MLQLIQEMPQILSEAAERLSFLFILHANYYINIQFDEIQAKKEGPSEKYQRAFFIIEHSKGNQGCLLVVSELQNKTGLTVRAIAITTGDIFSAPALSTSLH